MDRLEKLLREAKTWRNEHIIKGRSVEAAAAQIRIKAIEDCMAALKKSE